MKIVNLVSQKSLVLVCLIGLVAAAPSCAKRRPAKAKEAPAITAKDKDSGAGAKEVSKTMSALIEALSKVEAAESALKEQGLELTESTSASSSRAGFEVSVSDEAMKNLIGVEAKSESKSKAQAALVTLAKELAEAQKVATLTDASSKEENAESEIRDSVLQVLNAKAALVGKLIAALSK